MTTRDDPAFKAFHQAADNMRLHSRSVDQKCYNLAVHFLADDPNDTEGVRDKLAGKIQETVDDFLEALEDGHI